MHPHDLTPVERADLLDDAYREDRGLGTVGPDLVTRLELAEYLGGHLEVRVRVWEAWQGLMSKGGTSMEARRSTGWTWSL